MTFTHPHRVRYLEVDAQGVVFNSWYLAWFDDAMTAFLLHRGLPYADMLASGHDVQLVRSEIDWRTGVGFEDEVAIAVSTARLGRTSFALDFEVRLVDELPDPDERVAHPHIAGQWTLGHGEHGTSGGLGGGTPASCPAGCRPR